MNMLGILFMLTTLRRLAYGTARAIIRLLVLPILLSKSAVGKPVGHGYWNALLDRLWGSALFLPDAGYSPKLDEQLQRLALIERHHGEQLQPDTGR